MYLSLRRCWKGLFLLSMLSACTTVVPTVTSSATPTSATPQAVVSSVTSTPSPTRFGTIKLEAVATSGISGTFTAQDNGDGTTLLAVKLDSAADFNPWGLFAVDSCAGGVPLDQRPIFTLPDIEQGHKEETVETPAYEFSPGNLIVVIYGIAADGNQSIVACAELGPPADAEADASAALAPTSVSPDCTHTDVLPSEDDWLAFSASRNSNGDIYLLNVEETLQGIDAIAPLRLTTHAAADFDASWSPDGARIAFRSQRDGNDEIYVMNADGSCQTNLTQDMVNDWSPAWSPDGTHIAFARLFDGNPFTDIAVINVDGSGLKRLTTAHGEYPSWSPDGAHIAFASARDGNYEIYVMNADGTGQTRLTNNPAYDMSPAWSPDGTRIAFDTQRDGFPPVEVGIGPEFEIHIMNTDGSGDTRVTNNLQEDRFPEWASDEWIVFTQNGRLVLFNLNSSEQFALTDSGSFPAWRPSGHPVRMTLPALKPTVIPR